MLSHLSRLIAALILLAPVAAAQPGAQPPAQSQPAAQPAAPSKVTLKDAGAQPRRPLRFKPAAGSRQSAEMVVKMTQETAVSTMPPQKMEIPTITMPMVVEVTAVAANGDITETVTFGKPSAVGQGDAAAMAQGMNVALAGFENATATAVVSDRGVVRDASMHLAGGADPTLTTMAEQMTQSMKQFSVPVPEEAVGTGATWTVEFQTDVQGIHSSQAATYTLREFTPSGCTLDVKVTQSADKQDVKNPAMPPGMTVTLESLTGDSTGSTTLAFDRVMPVIGTNAGVVKTHMSMVQGGQPMDLQQTMHMDMQLREVQPGAQPPPAPSK